MTDPTHYYQFGSAEERQIDVVILFETFASPYERALKLFAVAWIREHVSCTQEALFQASSGSLPGSVRVS